MRRESGLHALQGKGDEKPRDVYGFLEGEDTVLGPLAEIERDGVLEARFGASRVSWRGWERGERYERVWAAIVLAGRDARRTCWRRSLENR